jgi:hypothetical protein
VRNINHHGARYISPLHSFVMSIRKILLLLEFFFTFLLQAADMSKPAEIQATKTKLKIHENQIFSSATSHCF